METTARPTSTAAHNLALRLGCFGPLTEQDQARIAHAAARAVHHPAHTQIDVGTPHAGYGSRLVASGWVAGAVLFADGRRQIVTLHLAGDLIEPELHGPPLTFVALTAAQTFAAEPLLGVDEPARPSERSGLERALANVRAVAIARRLRHIVRLGRLSAYERMADLILELYDRQVEAGGPDIGLDGSMMLPLTQEVLADHLGLSNVHANRVMQQLRQAGLIRQLDRTLMVPDPARLAAARPD